MRPQHRQAAEFVLAEGRRRPGVQLVLWDRRRNPKNVAEDVRKVAREKGDKAKVKAHPNGAVSVIVEGRTSSA